MLTERQFHSKAAAKYPEIYKAHPFEGWLAFLLHWSLIQVQSDKASITVIGAALIPYIDAKGYTAYLTYW